MNTVLIGRLAYKYRSGDLSTLSRDLRALADATFFASDRHSLNDPFEGRFDRSVLDRQFDITKGIVSAVFPTAYQSLDTVSIAAGDVLAFVDKSGIFSLSYNPLQELIWAHYGGSHRGFCIGYEIEKLIAFEPQLHKVLDIQYSDTAPTVTAADLISAKSHDMVLRKMLGVKSKPWSYEEEVRIITQPPGMHEYDFRAVKKIIFGLRCPESTIMAVMEALAGRGVTYEQVESPQSSYVMKSTTIADRYASAPRYKVNVAPIREGAIYPDYLKHEQKQYTSYLYRAAEIVRREPYCQEIQLIDFSGEKSSANNPVIFVQYLRAPNKWVNQYFTLPEIDRQYAALERSHEIRLER